MAVARLYVFASHLSLGSIVAAVYYSTVSPPPMCVRWVRVSVILEHAGGGTSSNSSSVVFILWPLLHERRGAEYALLLRLLKSFAYSYNKQQHPSEICTLSSKYNNYLLHFLFSSHLNPSDLLNKNSNPFFFNTFIYHRKKPYSIEHVL